MSFLKLLDLPEDLFFEVRTILERVCVVTFVQWPRDGHNIGVILQTMHAPHTADSEGLPLAILVFQEARLQGILSMTPISQLRFCICRDVQESFSVGCLCYQEPLCTVQTCILEQPSKPSALFCPERGRNSVASTGRNSQDLYSYLI